MARLPILITPEGHAKVKAELNELWRVERPRVTAEVGAAAELGDRSENAEYIYGKKRLREIDKRLQYLKKRLENMHVVSAQEQARNKGRVGFGAWVVVEDEEGSETTYRVIGPDEFDPDAGLISVQSPMGRALLGKEVGDEVEVNRPRGTAYFSVLAIHYGDRPQR